VVLMTAFGTIRLAVEAIRLGAVDFLEKPLPSNRSLRAAVERALAAAPPAGGAGGGDPVEGIVAGSAMQPVLALVRSVAARDTTVLLQGESGSGKEVLARAIHRSSRRRDGPFVAVNAAAIPATLAESELFGHEKGAFTGAAARHAGVFEQAAGGTILLDEIGELGPDVQVRLLRVLQERSVTPVGGTKPIDVDFRLLAATHRDLEALVRQGRFREDLYYRIAVLPIRVPPLRERREDIPALVARFAREIEPASPPAFAPAALARLAAHDWPGNVRELRNVVERAIVLAGRGPIGPAYVQIPEAARAAPPSPAAASLEEMERRAILEALEVTGGNRKEAAHRLGISLRTLQYRLKAYGMTRA
jgi:two-component system response regulator GlrR